MSATGFDFAKGSEKAWRFEGPDCRGSKVWENVKLKTAEGIGAIPGLKALRLLFDELASNGLEGSTTFRSRGIFAGHQGAPEIIAFLPGFRRQRASTASVLEWRGGFQHRSVALGAPNFDALINAPKDCRFANWPE